MRARRVRFVADRTTKIKLGWSSGYVVNGPAVRPERGKSDFELVGLGKSRQLVSFPNR